MNEARHGRACALVVAVAAAASLLSCQERLVDMDEESERGYHWCVIVNAARALDEEGNNAGTVLDEKGNQTNVCWCLTLEEGQSQSRREEVNEVAYEVCLANAAQMGYPGPEDNDCAYWHSIGHWGSSMFTIYPWHEHIVCDPDPDLAGAAGCSVR